MGHPSEATTGFLLKEEVWKFTEAHKSSPKSLVLRVHVSSSFLKELTQSTLQAFKFPKKVKSSLQGYFKEKVSKVASDLVQVPVVTLTKVGSEF